MQLLRGLPAAPVVGVIGLLAWEGQAMEIASEGKSRVEIVVDAGATDAERHAARELANTLSEVTGASFTAVHRASSARARILVGPGAARLADASFTIEGLGDEGIVIRSLGDDLILAGGRPRGTLYAVYTFLEDHVGCRWWTPRAARIPRKTKLTIGPLTIRYVPVLEFRETFWTGAFDGAWAARNKNNGNNVQTTAQQGGKNAFEGWAHTFYSLIPPETYSAEHPEWFSLVDGNRTHQVTARPYGAVMMMSAQLCLTNETMRRELVRNLRERLRKNPQATYASVSQNDEYPGFDGRCECEGCRALEEKEGSPAGPLLHFVNAVAADIEAEFPHVAITTLAYHYTRKPPRHVKPRPNVVIRLCSIECSFIKPLTDDANQAFRDDMVAWSKISDRLHIWDYVTNHAQNLLPHPNLRVLAPNVRFFVDHHATGIFEQGAYVGPGAEMAGLKAWVLAKLLWDPTLDGDELVKEFVSGYYEAAGPNVLAYLDLLHDAAEASGDWLGCFSGPDAAFLNVKVLGEGLQHLRDAQAAVAGDAELVLRVRSAQLPVLYTFLMRWDHLQDQARQAGADWPLADSIDEVHQDFMAVARQVGVVHLNEGCTGYKILEDAMAQRKKR